MTSSRELYSLVNSSTPPWLEEIPHGWTTSSVRGLFRWMQTFGGVASEVLSLSSEHGVRKPSGKMGRAPSLNLDAYPRVEPGDLVVNRLVARDGALAVSAHAGIVSPAYWVLRPHRERLDSTYCHFLMRAHPVVAEIARISKNQPPAQFDVLWQDFRGLFLPMPSIEDQRLIGRYLLILNRKIQRGIGAKQKLIKLLQEQKQAIVRCAVTRGLDPNVRLKASDVEWLGSIPEHWVTARAGGVCEFISAKAHEQFVEPDGEHICVTARFVSTDGRSFRRCTRNLSPAQRGDVLMVMSDLPRGRALARAYYVNDGRSYAVNQRVCILRANRAHSRFIAFAVDRHSDLMAHDDGFNQTHLPNAAFKTMRVPLPPLEEQAAIADFLDRATRVIEAYAAHAAREIDLLREFRARLIADVVTGKLDVREAALSLPDLHEEPDSLDDATSLADAEDAVADDLEAVAEEVQA